MALKDFSVSCLRRNRLSTLPKRTARVEVLLRHRLCKFKMVHKILWLALGWVVVGASVLSAEPHYGGKVVIGAPGGLAPLNPIITCSTVSTNLFDILFDRLLQESPDGDIAPGLAISWQPGENYRTWDFKLREGVHFQDGRPVTAEDVVFTFQMIKQFRDKKTWTGVPSLAFERMEVIDPYTVRVHFSRPPDASFLYQLREHILPRHIVEPQLQSGKSIKEIPFNTHPIGSGPFQLDSWDGNAQVELTAFKDYWNGRPYLDTVEVKAGYQGTQDLWAGLMRGEVEVVTHSSLEDLESIAKNERFKTLRGVGPFFLNLFLNCRQESLLTDRHLREALNYAIDRRAIWRYIGGSEEIADSLIFPTGPFLPGSPYNDPQVPAPIWSPEQASKLLEAAGWKLSADRVRRKNGISLELMLLMPVEFPFSQKVAAQLRKDLEEVGIRLYVRTESANTLYTRTFLEKTRFDLLWEGGTYYPDPDLTIYPWYSSGPRNFSGYANPEVDRLIGQGRSAYDNQQRLQIYRHIHQQIAEDQPVLFVCRFPLSFALSRGFRGTELFTRIGLFRSLPAWYLQN